MALTRGRGVDTAIEAVGIPATFKIWQDVVRRAAYDTFGNAAAETKALKVIVKA